MVCFHPAEQGLMHRRVCIQICCCFAVFCVCIHLFAFRAREFITINVLSAGVDTLFALWLNLASFYAF